MSIIIVAKPRNTFCECATQSCNEYNVRDTKSIRATD